MRSNAKEALSDFNKGLNCAQTVLSAFCEGYGLSRETAYRIAGGLGGGMRSGEICGAVSGAVLVIGLKHGQETKDGGEAKKNCNEKTEEFLKKYREANGSIICRDLLGCDVSTDEGRKTAVAKDLYNTVCVEKIKSAITLLEELGY